MKTPPSFDYYFENSLKGPAECQKQEIRAMAERRCRRSEGSAKPTKKDQIKFHQGHRGLDHPANLKVCAKIPS